jgi:Flavin-binding monooxygenase-like
VVGAGASGITAARSLSARGLGFDWFEKGDRVGGTWAFENSSGLSAAYRHLHINVSKERIEFSDRPMPDSYPLFPHRAQLEAYFRDYVEHFGLDRHLRLGSGVERAEPTPDGRWEVVLDGGERRLYDALVVANGHHSKPLWPRPAPPGEFAGRLIHSHDYRDNSILRDRDVVVVGLGNSAADIASESAQVARSTHLSVRRGAHVLPKIMYGFPFDQVPGLEYMMGKGIGWRGIGVQVPRRLRRWVLTAGLRGTVGSMERYGLPKPGFLYGATHPTISPRLLDGLLHGRVVPKPVIERFDSERVVFADRSSVRADVVVYCTGYEIGFPFLPPDLVPVVHNRVDLYWNVFPPHVPNLAFVGVLQPSSGSTMQIAEIQARWVAAQLAGDYALPSEREMLAAIARQRRAAGRRYVQSPRHTVQVDQFDYEWRLQRELRRGRRRAHRNPSRRSGEARVRDAAAASSPAVAERAEMQEVG